MKRIVDFILRKRLLRFAWTAEAGLLAYQLRLQRQAEQQHGVTCECGVPSHATGAADICTCEPASERPVIIIGVGVAESLARARAILVSISSMEKDPPALDELAGMDELFSKQYKEVVERLARINLARQRVTGVSGDGSMGPS